MKRRVFISTLLLALCAVRAPAAETPAALPDQFGQTGGLQDFAGQPVLAIVVSARKLRHIQRWEERLRADLPQLVSLRVADVAEDPLPDPEAVAAKLRKRTPENVSIYIDMQNTWAREFELDTNEPCLLLFDEQHALVAQFRGRANKDRVDEVRAVVADYFPAANITDDIS